MVGVVSSHVTQHQLASRIAMFELITFVVVSVVIVTLYLRGKQKRSAQKRLGLD